MDGIWGRINLRESMTTSSEPLTPTIAPKEPQAGPGNKGLVVGWPPIESDPTS